MSLWFTQPALNHHTLPLLITISSTRAPSFANRGGRVHLRAASAARVLPGAALPMGLGRHGEDLLHLRLRRLRRHREQLRDQGDVPQCVQEDARPSLRPRRKAGVRKNESAEASVSSEECCSQCVNSVLDSALC